MFMLVISFHTFYCALSFSLFSGEFFEALHLFTSSEEAWKDQVILTLTNVMGLVFIFIGLGVLGPIQLAFITSSRKVISVLASIIAFNKRITSTKLVGIVLVLSGMVAENIFKDTSKEQGSQEELNHNSHLKEGKNHRKRSHKSEELIEKQDEGNMNVKNRDLLKTKN